MVMITTRKTGCVAALNTAQDQKEGDVVVHPEYVVSFGEIHAIGTAFGYGCNPRVTLWQTYSQCILGFVVRLQDVRSVYVEFPHFVRSDSAQTGFGFEDWHWNLEVLAGGVRHVSAPDTAIFYRRKMSSDIDDASSTPR